MGLNFVRGGPPTFKNAKKKEDYNPDNSHKDLRDVIEEEKHREHDQHRHKKPRGDKHYDEPRPYKKRGGYNGDDQRGEY